MLKFANFYADRRHALPLAAHARTQDNNYSYYRPEWKAPTQLLSRSHAQGGRVIDCVVVVIVIVVVSTKIALSQDLGT